MANDSIGTARVDIVIDLAQYELAIKRAKNAASGFGEEAEAAFDKQNSRARQAARSLLDWVQNLGKSREEIKLLKAAGMGVDPTIIEAATAAINNYRRGLAETAAETAKLAALHTEALTWDAERTRQQGTAPDFEGQQRAAQAAQRRAEATEALTLALYRQDAAEEALKNADRYAEEERSAQAKWRRAEATEALTIALMRQDAAEEAVRNAAQQERDVAASQAAWRRADATHALTSALEMQEDAERRITQRGEFLRDLGRQEKEYGKTRIELMEMRAAELGLQQQAAPLIASLKAKEQATERYGYQLDKSKRQINEYGLSQKQLEFAMRGVPAQMTDIIVSLQGGQAPLTVLLQQGGQLKDMFGGIKPAAAAIGGEFLKLINVWTVSAAAVTALTIAAYKGSQESNQFAKALALTGNNAGVTVDSLQMMAAAIDDTGQSTQASASRAIAAVAGTGKIARENFQLIATAADDMYRATGKAIDDTVAEYVKLSKDPLKAIYELNEGQNFLTYATYQQIKALTEQGKASEATALATRTYAEATIEAARGVEQNLGTLEKAWKYLKIGASEAWDAMMGIGRNTTAAMQLQKQMLENQRDMGALQRSRDPTSGFVLSDAQQKQLEDRILKGYDRVKELNQQMGAEQLEADKALARRNANAAAIETDRLITSQASKAQQRAVAIKEENARIDKGIADARFAGQVKLAEELESRRAAAVAAIEKKYADPKTSKTGQNDAQRAALQAFKDQAETTNATIQANTRTTQAAFNAGKISATDYYSKMKQFVAEELASNEKAIEGQLAYLRAAKSTIANRQKIGELEADLAKVRAKAAADTQVLGDQEEEATKKRTQAMEDYANALRASEDAQKRNIEAQVQALGLGDREGQRVAQITKLYTDQADKLFQLATLAKRNPQNANEYAEQEALLRASTDRQVAQVNSGYQQMDAARGSWMVGYSRAFQNYNDEMMNVAGHTQEFFTNVTGGIESMLEDMAINGKATFTDLTNAIIKQLIRLGTQKMLVWIMSMWGAPSAGASQGTMANFGNNPGWTANAKGNVYSSDSLSAYSNGVYNTPKTFAFAKGAGIFAEAGPEAIMPLSRGADGKLGVQASGAAGGNDITVNVYGAPEGTKVEQRQDEGGGVSIDVLIGQIESKMAGNVAAGVGPLNTAIKARYKLQETV